MLPKPKSSEVGHTVTAGQSIKDGSQAITEDQPNAGGD